VVLAFALVIVVLIGQQLAITNSDHDGMDYPRDDILVYVIPDFTPRCCLVENITNHLAKGCGDRFYEGFSQFLIAYWRSGLRRRKVGVTTPSSSRGKM
jgi:hypothetical protein